MVFRKPFRRSGRSLTKDIASISALDDPIRAAILKHVATAGVEVSRDQAAEAVGVTRRVAAFHLDRLAEEGWLTVTYRRLTGRSGPGAGRSSKLYRRSAKRVEVSVPTRNYELMARLFASAARTDGAATLRELEPVARDFGTNIGRLARMRGGDNPTSERLVQCLVDALSDEGFEPFDDRGVGRLRNCPFHEMARENTDLICSMNLALMQGMARGIGLSHVTPRLAPVEGICCVAFYETPGGTTLTTGGYRDAGAASSE